MTLFPGIRASRQSGTSIKVKNVSRLKYFVISYLNMSQRTTKHAITKTLLFKYIENFTAKNFQIKKI